MTHDLTFSFLNHGGFYVIFIRLELKADAEKCKVIGAIKPGSSEDSLASQRIP